MVRKTASERRIGPGARLVSAIAQVIQRGQGYSGAGKGAFGVPVMGARKLEWDRGRVMSSWGNLSLSSRKCMDMLDQETERPQPH